MAASVVKIELAGFGFPKALPNDKANFRFVADVRYVDREGSFITEHVVMPSLDTFWECDTRKAESPNFVRGADEGAFSTFEMNRIDEWDRLILTVKAESVQSIQVKVFDVNRDDVWNRLKDMIGQVIEALMGYAGGALGKLPGVPQTFKGESFGNAIDDVVSNVLKRLSNGDEILFRGSKSLSPAANEIVGVGTGGRYRVAIRLSEVAA